MIRLIGIFILPILVLLLSGNAFGQNTFEYPTTFSQFFNHYPLLNPGATGTESRAVFRTGNQFNSDLYNRIRCFFALAEFQLNKDKNLHAMGLSFMNNKEGNLLDFNRAYFQYAFHLSLSEEWKLSSGITLGFLNFSAEQTSSSARISSYAPDGSLGLWLYRDKEKIGFSFAQMFDKSLRVINEQILINRFYRMIYSRSFSLSPYIKFIPAAQLAINKKLREADLNTSFLLKDLVMIGVSYRFDKGTAYFFGLNNFLFLGNPLDLSFSYNTLWPSSNLSNIQTFELILAYKLQNNSKKIP